MAALGEGLAALGPSKETRQRVSTLMADTGDMVSEVIGLGGEDEDLMAAMARNRRQEKKNLENLTNMRANRLGYA